MFTRCRDFLITLFFSIPVSSSFLLFYLSFLSSTTLSSLPHSLIFPSSLASPAPSTQSPFLAYSLPPSLSLPLRPIPITISPTLSLCSSIYRSPLTSIRMLPDYLQLTCGRKLHAGSTRRSQKQRDGPSSLPRTVCVCICIQCMVLLAYVCVCQIESLLERKL